jgi:hypothetical protein
MHPANCHPAEKKKMENVFDKKRREPIMKEKL